MMKRTYSLLVTLALLLGSIAVFSVTPTAEEATGAIEQKEPILTYFVEFAGGNNASYGNTAPKVFDIGAPGNGWVSGAGIEQPGDAYVVGMFATPSCISSVYLHVTNFGADCYGRANEATVWASTDGADWKLIATAPENVTEPKITLDVDPEYTSTPFKYIKVASGKPVGGVFSLVNVTAYGIATEKPIENIVYLEDESCGTYLSAAYNHAATVFAPDSSYNVWSSPINPADKAAYITGRLPSPTRITRVDLYGTIYVDCFNRMNGAIVEGWTGSEWETIATAPAQVNSRVVCLEVTSENSYTKIRVSNGSGVEYFQLGHVAVFGESTLENLNPEFVEYAGGYYGNLSGHDNANKVFVWGNTDIWTSAQNLAEKGSAYVVGQLPNASCISTIVLKGSKYESCFNRLSGATVEASVNGEDWVTIAQAPDDVATREISLDVDPAYQNTAFRYIKVANGDIELSDQVFSLTNVIVYGTTAAPKFVGSQATAVTEGKQSIRFLATLDMLNYSAAGYELTATYTPADASEAVTVQTNATVSSVYTSVMALEDGQPVEVTAEELGGKYLMVLSVHNVPANVGEVIFVVTPYAVQGGEVIRGESVAVIYNNGSYVVA